MGIMTRTTPPPLVDQTYLQLERAVEAIAVGSPAWYAWLGDATSFAFRSQHGTFTAYKERRGPAQEYWKAYRRRAGRLQRMYLGKSGELTLDRLNAVAAELGEKISAGAPPSAATASDRPLNLADTAESVLQDAPVPAEQDRSFHLQESSSLYATAAFAASDDAQSLHLLSTKLAIPALHAQLVPRPRLAAQLDLAIAQQQKLILVAAPAGFGKTTLIAEWLVSRTEGRGLWTESIATSPNSQSSVLSTQVAWLALDDADNQLGQFLAYLIAALETARPKLGAEAWALLRAQAAHPPTHAILTSLLNVLAAPSQRIVLVLDDYHTIGLQAIHEAIAFLLERMPAHMHVMITTRADPPLPLARLRARGQLTEMRAADLRFSSGEAAYLFDHIHGIALESDAVISLETRTEGWATGLQLAALSLRQQDAADLPRFLANFTGSHSYVFDYLAEEVFQRQPDHVRNFLVETAILGRLCGPLCAAVTGQDNAQTLLEDLDQANLFLVRLDSHRRWYRYHHLFRDFLLEHLERASDAADQALLHRRASAWFEQQTLVGEAIDHALHAEEWSAAMRCFAPLLASERFYDYYLDWPRWVAALPDAGLSAEPDLCLRLAWILVFTGHIEASERPLGLAETAWRAAGNQPKFGELLSYRSLIVNVKGDFPRAILLAQQALAKLPADAIEQHGLPTYILGNSDLNLGHAGAAIAPLTAAYAALQHGSEMFLMLGAAAGLAYAYQLQGQLRRAAALYHDVIRRAGDVTHHQVPAASLRLGTLCYEWNDLDAAERMLRTGIEVARRIGRDRYWASAYSALARVCWAREEGAEAITLIERALEAARQLDNPREIAEAEAAQAWLWLVQGDDAAAIRWLAARSLDIDATVAYERQAEYFMLARIRIAQTRHAGAVDLDAVVHLLERLRQAADTDGRTRDRIEILALIALTHAAEGQMEQALARLVEALRLAEPEGYIRTFVDEGAPMRSLVQALRQQLPAIEPDDRLLAYVDQLLGAFQQNDQAGPITSASASLLSEREHAVLGLIAEGRSIAEIAAILVISAHTARTHVKNIYLKLDAHNRVQALDRARALQLL